MKTARWILIILCAGCSSTDTTKLDVKIPSPIAVSSQALFENDDSNCGAEGYACVDGRTCIDSVCSPAWIEMEDDGAPSAMTKHSAASIDGKFLMVGGCTTVSTQNPALATSVLYDPSNDTWDSGPSIPTGRAQAGIVSSPGGVFLFGGLSTCYDGISGNSQLDALYDLGEGWSSVLLSNVPDARYNASVALSDSSLFVFGGSNLSSATLTKASNLTMGHPWEAADCDLSGCGRGGGFFSFVDDNVLHVMSDEGGLLYDFENERWYNWVLPSGTPDFSTLTDGDPPRFGDDGQRIFVLANDDTVRIFDRKTQSWVTDSSTPPSGFCSEAATAWVGSELFAWGGKCDSSLSAVGGRYQPPAPSGL